MQIIRMTYYAFEFLLYYLLKLVQSNIYIAWDILTPTMHVDPGIIEIETELNTDMGLLLFSNLLSMTPGTLSLDISEDKKIISVHVLYKTDEIKVLKEIDGIKKRIKRLTN